MSDGLLKKKLLSRKGGGWDENLWLLEFQSESEYTKEGWEGGYKWLSWKMKMLWLLR